jgi:hypothetical protein
MHGASEPDPASRIVPAGGVIKASGLAGNHQLLPVVTAEVAILARVGPQRRDLTAVAGLLVGPAPAGAALTQLSPASSTCTLAMAPSPASSPSCLAEHAARIVHQHRPDHLMADAMPPQPRHKMAQRVGIAEAAIACEHHL